MLTATDPTDMTPEDRRREIAAILAAGFLRSQYRPAQAPAVPDARMLPPATADKAPDAATSPPDSLSTPAATARRPLKNPPEFSRN